MQIYVNVTLTLINIKFHSGNSVTNGEEPRKKNKITQKAKTKMFYFKISYDWRTIFRHESSAQFHSSTSAANFIKIFLVVRHRSETRRKRRRQFSLSNPLNAMLSNKEELVPSFLLSRTENTALFPLRHLRRSELLRQSSPYSVQTGT